MKLCMATVSIGGSLVEKIEAIGAAGFDSLELFDDDLRKSGMTPEECARRCADQGLAIDLYQPFRRAEGISADEFREVLTRFRGELDIMRRLGAGSILVVSNTDADADASRDLSAAQLVGLGDAAAELGMTVMFEALAWGTHISRVADAWEVVRLAGHPNVVLVVDTFHLNAAGEDVSVVAGLPRDSVGFFQVADAPRLSMDVIQWSRNHRCFPGEGEFDVLTPIVSAIASGYRGPLSLEIFNPGYRERSPIEVAKLGAESLRQLVGELSGQR